jgi:hypothetical protein
LNDTQRATYVYPDGSSIDLMAVFIGFLEFSPPDPISGGQQIRRAAVICTFDQTKYWGRGVFGSPQNSMFPSL